MFDARSGRILNAALADYHIPAHLDVPEIDVMWTGIPDPRSPFGARGIGEIGVTGVAARRREDSIRRSWSHPLCAKNRSDVLRR